MFRVFSGLNWAVFLVSHVVAVQWQLLLESSEVTVNTGCQQGAKLGCQLECLHLDSPCGLGCSQLGGWVQEGRSQGSVSFCLGDQSRSCKAAYDLASEDPQCHLSRILVVVSKSQGNPDSREEILQWHKGLVLRSMVHWGPSWQSSCYDLFCHDYVGASVPSLLSFVYFS